MASTTPTTAERWHKIEGHSPDGIFALAARANAAKDPKANLVVGAYRDEQGRPYPLHVVRKAERLLLDMNLDYEYLPIAGLQAFVDDATKMLYGDAVESHQIVGVQTISGTGAIALGAKLLTHVYDPVTTPIYLSNPTWPNHHAILPAAGWKDIRSYSYYDPETMSLDFEGIKKDIHTAPNGSIFVLHQCAHNPTGVDPTHAQWEEIADLMLAKKHQVFFDSAYQGYASGSLDEDAFAARLFAGLGLEVMVAQSFSKNMGLYSERAGALSVIIKDKTKRADVKSVMESLIREEYSSPPAHGARLAHLILSSNDLRKEWEAELADMAGRIRTMRRTVYNELKRLETPGSWEHVINQIGMFSFLGLTKEQCQYCQDHNVFITLTGRANMAGLTHDTALMLARTINDAVSKLDNK
ncbi:putative aspartate aminotransferase [Leptomonas pyrrhocoris]|uniref:Putative aspartate aminotransferase n=1 Tax=Leptomonas pyrrhocoris TaxID=157538 RepID=A0A0M9GAD9_LEPPY|nr:putative aspartate aminotransferase [Leptomonas pyrrhocoris]KPA85956.1 putative aspartate aminotransferase [Leptomonas pyrrhocoris]|eukprot:XP_015664395.1 putative aspartate aminotransferase [Leptomonas pyrrhocoris]